MTTTDPGRTAEPMTQDEAIASIGNYGYGWHDSDTAGATAQRGRTFVEEEDRTPDTHPVAVISDALWRARFSACGAG